MAVKPIEIAQEIQRRFRRYLLTTFPFPERYGELRRQFEEELAKSERLFRGPFLHGLAPYVYGTSLAKLVAERVLPKAVVDLPFFENPDRSLYKHQEEAIRRLRKGRNVIVSTGTGSGKTFAFLVPILADILEKPRPGVHTLLLYPMNALVNDQLKNLRRLLCNVPQIRFGRYVNKDITPQSEKAARASVFNKNAPANEVVSREVFRSQPPHILITNYAMLEYLLLRVDDSPLFEGPWRFIVADEAHTYTGAKGTELALLIRRVQARVAKTSGKPPQCIATSASLGVDSPHQREEVLHFAETLFNLPFAEDDLIVAKKKDVPAEGTCTPDESIYVHPEVAAACRSDVKWTEDLSTALKEAGFLASIVQKGAERGADSVEQGLYEVFQTDSRVLKLRQAVSRPSDLATAAMHVFGATTPDALERLAGLVSVYSLARAPGGEARLVPCRYHMFVRGLNGAYVALSRIGQEVGLELYLEPTNQSEDGTRKTLELRACRKCGQPYLVGFRFSENGKEVLKAFGSPGEQRGEIVWFTWEAPETVSEDEEEEGEVAPSKFDIVAYEPKTGSFRVVPEVKHIKAEELQLWRVAVGKDHLSSCVACGGTGGGPAGSVTSIRADSDAAQSAVADAFYRRLPLSHSPVALDYHGQGRKLLAFADGRQSAAYFAPYLENSNQAQLLRSLIYEGLCKVEGKTDEPIKPEDLVDFMISEGKRQKYFRAKMTLIERQTVCKRTLLKEFCLKQGRRQSLEALGLVSCYIDLEERWDPPAALVTYLTKEEAYAVVQNLLTTIRLQKAIEMPEPVVSDDAAFAFQRGEDGFVAKGSEHVTARFRLHGFAPERAPRTQRRARYLQRVLNTAAAVRKRTVPSDDAIRQMLDEIWTSLIHHQPHSAFIPTTLAHGQTGYQLKWDSLAFMTRGNWHYCPSCQQWSAHSALGVCPSFRCDGSLQAADPRDRMRDNHYRLIYSDAAERPKPLVAREHTAQLAPDLATAYQLAFQEGHHDSEGQINVLSSSTTFELGVDLGDLEAVFLRNVPPSPANYQQRAGRAGRSIGSAAFAVTFAMPRSHDEHYFNAPAQMIDGLVRPPRIDLRNEFIVRRHIHAVLLADFVRRWRSDKSGPLESIAAFMEPDAQNAKTPLDHFLNELPALIKDNRPALERLAKSNQNASYLDGVSGTICEDFDRARQYYADNIKMYEDADTEQQNRAIFGHQGGATSVRWRGWNCAARTDAQLGTHVEARSETGRE